MTAHLLFGSAELCIEEGVEKIKTPHSDLEGVGWVEVWRHNRQNQTSDVSSLLRVWFTASKRKISISPCVIKLNFHLESTFENNTPELFQSASQKMIDYDF